MYGETEAGAGYKHVRDWSSIILRFEVQTLWQVTELRAVISGAVGFVLGLK